MKNPRLLLVGSLPPPYSGYETATEVLMNCGLDRDFQLELVDTRTTRNPSMRGRWSAGNFVSMAIVWLRLLSRLARFRPHVCNVPLAQNRTGFLKWLLLAASCKASGARLVSRLGGASFDSFYANSSPMMRAVIRLGLRLPDSIIVRGPSMRHQFSGLVDGSRLVVVPNGFDLRGWEESFASADAGPHKEAEINVLYLGQVSRAKGVLDLLAAIGMLHEKREAAKFRFVIAGPVIEKEMNLIHLDSSQSTGAEIARLMRDGGIEGMVEFAGEVDLQEKIKLYSRSDVFVYPSYSEGGVPYSMLEAFASQCAVICTRTGPAVDYLRHGEEVLFVPLNAPADIARCLLELEDAGLRKRLVRNARDYLASNHGLEAFASRMCDVFNDALSTER